MARGRKLRLGIPDEDLQAHCVHCDTLLNIDNGEPAAFSDDMTDLSVMFDRKIPARPIFAGGLTTGGVAEKLEGTRAQRKNWGLSYKTAEYKELDRLIQRIFAQYQEVFITGSRGTTKTYNAMLSKMGDGRSSPYLTTKIFGTSSCPPSGCGTR